MVGILLLLLSSWDDCVCNLDWTCAAWETPSFILLFLVFLRLDGCDGNQILESLAGRFVVQTSLVV